MVACSALWGGCATAISPEGRKVLRAANAAYLGGDDTAAVRSASRFLQMHPRAPEAAEAHYLRGLARCRQGLLAAAKADLRTAAEDAKRDDLKALCHAKLGELAYREGNLAVAKSNYEAVLAHAPPGAPPSDQAFYRLGGMHQRSGRWRQADQMYHRLRYLFDGSDLARRAGQRVGARFWSIQAGAFTSPATAGALRGQLAGAGIAARVDPVVRDGKLMRLVRVGAYPTCAAAEADLAKVRRIRSDAFAVPAQ